MILTREEENLLDVLKLEQIIEIFSVTRARTKINISFLLMQVNVKDRISYQ